MGSTFFSLHYHIALSTKKQRPFIKSEWHCIADVLRDLKEGIVHLG